MKEDVIKCRSLIERICSEEDLQYETPVLELLGSLGEVIRGDGSQTYDLANGCTSSPGDYENETVCPPG